MTKTKRLLTILMAISMLVCSTCFADFSTFAATSNEGNNWEHTIIVTTSNEKGWFNPTITLGQTHGTRKSSYIWGRTRYEEEYGDWTINIKSTDGATEQTEYLTGGSKKIYLEYGKTYRITVKWTPNRKPRVDGSGDFVTIPVWYVSDTYAVSNYY